LAAQKALVDPISVNHIRTAARNWYQRDKESSIKAHKDVYELLHWIIDEVIGGRRARAFLLGTHINHELIDILFDERILHILKKNISSHDQPGIRYDAYKLDYGCYVDLITTSRAPQTLLSGFEETDTLSEVPPDDYRAIRRAILEIEKFLNRNNS
jgi:hypothetical protein